MRGTAKAAAASVRIAGGRNRKLLLGLLAAAAAILTLGATLASALAPSVTVENATDVGYTSADVKGTVDPEGQPTTWRFQYIADAQFQENLDNSLPGFEGANTAHEEGVEGEDPLTIERELTSLTPGTTYHLRLQAENGDGTSEDVAADTFKTLEVATPVVLADDAGSATDSSAHFSGTVEVANSDEAFTASCFFDYVKDSQFQASGFDGAQQIACDPTPVTGPGVTPVEAEPADLEPNSTYHLRLRAENAGGTGTDEAPGTFTTEATAAEITDSPTLEPTQTTATVVQNLNPHNAPVSDCHFVYGIGGVSEQEVPCEGATSGNTAQSVQLGLTGLTPGSVYHFKLIVTTTAGTVEGDEQIFFTASPAPAESCPNQAIREQQDARAPDCRAYEMVTPVDKNGGEISDNSLSSVAALGGGRLAYSAIGSFGDTEGSGPIGHTQYVARREESGWTSHGVGPTPAYDAPFQGVPLVFNFSDDLSRAVVSAYNLPSGTGDNGLVNLFSEETWTRELRPVTTPLAGPVPF